MTNLIPEEVEFIELAAGVRKVRTPEGSKFYGLPIGAPITADIIAAKKAEGAAQGVTAPKGALSKGSTPTYAGADAPVDGQDPQAAPAAAPAGQVTQIPSTLNGPMKFKVGGKSYSAPTGSTLIKPKAKDGLLYVRTKDGQLHAFNAVDEVPIPEMLQKLFATKFGPNFKGDDNYEMMPFDDGEGKSLDDLPAGAALKDDEGITQFTKMANGDWENPELGAIVTSSDLQELYDSGELTVPDTATGVPEEELPDYANMSKDEYFAAMAGHEPGHQIHMANLTFTKLKGNGWKNENSGKEISHPPFSMRKIIKPAPTATVEDKYEQDVKSAEAKGEEPPKLPKSMEEQPPAPKAADKVHAPAPELSADEQKAALKEKLVGFVENGHISLKAYDEMLAAGNKAIDDEEAAKAPKDVKDMTLDEKKAEVAKAADLLVEQGTWTQEMADNFKKVGVEHLQKLDDEEKAKAKKDEQDAIGKSVAAKGAEARKAKTGDIAGEGGKIKKSEPAKVEPEGEAMTTEEELDALPVGHVIAEQWPGDSTTYEYTKTSTGKWQAPSGALFSSWDMLGDVKSSNTTLKSLKAIKKPVASKPRVDTKTQLTSDDIATMEPGENILIQNSDLNMQFVATKLESGLWKVTSEDGGDEYDEAGIGADVDNGVAHRYVFTRKAMKSKKAGDQISINVPGEKQLVATKESNGQWSWGGKSFDETMLYADLDDGFITEILPVDISAENGDRAKKIEEAVAAAAEDDNGPTSLPEGKEAITSFDGLDGDDELEVYSSKGGLVMTLKKDEFNGKWVDQSESTFVFWSEYELGPWMAEGKIAANFGKPKLGSKITKHSQLDELPEGAEAKNNVGIKVSKIANNLWTTNGADELTSDKLQSWLDVSNNGSGAVVVSSLPSDTPAEETLQVFSNGPVVSKSAVQAALDGLEGHSGFQIAYGLKNLPAESPFKDEEFLSSIKADAAAAFPDMKPKPALVAHLKAKLGVQEQPEELAEWELELLGVAPSPEVLIGSEESKDTQTGVTGGKFKISDIEKAIELLDGFEGKNFKSFLNLQGNPLGTLSPNHIVGFNKDKTITKKNFVDLLKKKVEDNKAAAPKPTVEELKELVKDEPTDWHEGDAVTYDNIDTLPIDSFISFDDGEGSEMSTYDLKKIDDDLWQHTQNSGYKWSKAVLQGGLNAGLYKVNSLPSDYTPTSAETETEEPSAPEPEAPAAPAGPQPTLLDEPIVVSWDEFKNLPVGAKIIFDPGSGYYDYYVLDADGQWHDEGYYGSSFGPEDFKDLTEKGQISLRGYTGEEPQISKPAEPVGEIILTVDEYHETVAGDVVSLLMSPDSKPMIFTKISDTQWANQSGAQTSHEGLLPFAEDGQLTLKPTLKKAKPLTGAEFDKLQVGSLVSMKNGYGDDVHYLKTKNGQFKNVITGSLIDKTAVKAYVGDGLILVSVPNEDEGDDSPNPESHVPDYAAPTAADAEKSQAVWTEEQVDEAPEGTLLVNATDPDLYYQKESTDGTTWQAWKKGVSYGAYHSNNVKTWIANGTVKPVDAPENPSGLVPGKYTNTGKTFMYVNSDGTGVFVNTKGQVSALTVAKVKSNYAAGMKTYYGASETPPKVSATQAVAAKAKAPVGDISELPDGKYYLGSPSSAVSTVYEVEGDKVTIFKPKKTFSTTAGDVKVGQKINNEFLQLAPVGTTLHYKDGSYYNYDLVKVSNEGELDGQWASTVEGQVLPNWVWNEMGNSYHNSKFKITSMGLDAPESVDKTKLKTQFLKGQLVDSLGNSVVPKNYSGAVSFFESATDIQSLMSFKAELDGWAPGQGFSFNAMQAKYGLNVNQAVIKAEVTKINEGYTPDGAVAYMQATLADLTKDLDTEVPDSNAAELFEWDAMGYAKMPLDVFLLETPSYYYSTGQFSEYIKTVSSHFGGGSIIGQHYTWMTKDQKQLWVQKFKAGDFKGMYQIEVEAAASKQKPHAAGYLHPGYSGNEKTNQVTWGPQVSGEIPAGEKVEGEWTSSGVDASMEEINNYIIKAQMQNPTFLNNSEKRNWVKYHQNGNKQQVDHLSALALQRQKQGQAPISEPPVWTDDVKPSKSYDSLFDSTEFPISSWNYVKAGDWLKDNWDKYPDLPAFVSDYSVQQGYGPVADVMSGNDYINQQAVSNWFQKLKDDYEAELLKPVYTKEPNQTVQKSTHPVFNYTDQFGQKYFFKPRPNTKLDKYRSEVEHLGNKFGHFFGFKTADSKLVELDGKYGQLQADVGGIADLMNYDYSTLSVNQIADIGAEHMLDWFLDNDDTKGDNAKILPNGHIVGIDKGRAFKHFGSWAGLSGDSSMNSNAHTIYSQLFDAIRGGKISKEDADAAFQQIRKRAKKMAKASDQRITEMLAEGMVNREQYDINYKINGKKVSQDLKGLTAAVLDRKNNLPEQIEEMWAKVYKDAGFGALPEAPNNPLGEVISGLDDDRLHDEVFKVEANGKNTVIANAGVIGGSVLTWTDETADGNTNINGEMFLGPKLQKEILSWFTANATEVSGNKTQVQGFAQYDTYGQTFIGAAKTINHHSVDGNYNEGKINEFNAAHAKIKADLAFWTPGMESNSTIAGEPSYMFSSGANVPMIHVDQYKMMLDYYHELGEKIKKAHEDKGKTETVSTYTPLNIKDHNVKWTKPDGSSLQEMSNGSYLYTNASSGSVQSVGKDALVVQDSQSGIGGWEKMETTSLETDSGLLITKNTYTHEKSAKIEGSKKKITSDEAGGVNGSAGSEFQITLPTGEKIFFRNASHTSTKRGQHGKLVFRAEGVSNAQESQAAMARISSQLNDLGIGTDAADETSAELIYWREMYGILENRNHTSGTPLDKASKAMKVKVKEIGGNEDEFLENLSEKMTDLEQIEFWRSIWGDAVGKDKVDNMVATEGYLPKYDHQNLSHTDIETGKAYWERFDVTFDEIVATNVVIASATGGEPNPMIKAGAALGAEERLRQADQFMASGSWSAASDQAKGSSHNIYTRLVSDSTVTEYNAVYNPKMLLRTRTYSFGSDTYGDLSQRKAGAPANPLEAIKKFKGSGGNETMLPHMATLLDGVELYGFESASERNEMIQYLKALGIDMIRGLPVEDRLVMRTQLKTALEKVKQTWK